MQELDLWRYLWIRHALICVLADTSEQNLFSIHVHSIYVELGQLLQTYVSRLEMPTVSDFQREIVSLLEGFGSILYDKYSTSW